MRFYFQSFIKSGKIFSFNRCFVSFIGNSIKRHRLPFVLIAIQLGCTSTVFPNSQWSELLAQADSLANANRYDSAVVLADEALGLAQTRFGKVDTAVARICYVLGTYYYRLGNYTKSKQLSGHSLGIREKILGANHPDVAVSLVAVGKSFDIEGMFDKAEPLYKRALQIQQEWYGNKSLEAAETMNLLSVLYYYTEDLAVSERFGKQSLSIWGDLLGYENEKVIRALNNLGLIYMKHENYEKAEEFLRRCLDILRRITSDNNPKVASVLNNLAIIYQEQGRFHKSEESAREALTIKEMIYGMDHPKLSPPLVTLATACLGLSKYSEAEKLYLRQIAIKEKTHGKDHPAVAFGLQGLADVYKMQQKYLEAGELYNRALTLFETYFGDNSPHVAETLEKYSHIQYLLGFSEESFQSAYRATDIRKHNFQDNAWVLSERNALVYSHQMQKSADNYLSLLFSKPDELPANIDKAANVILTVKGNVSDGIFERHRKLVTETDRGTLDMVNEFKDARGELAQLFMSGSRDEPGKFILLIDSLERAADSLESELMAQSHSFRKIYNSRNVNLERVVSLIPPRSVLIEFKKFKFSKIQRDQEEDHYLAMVLSPSKEIELIDLGSTVIIDSIVNLYRQHMFDVVDNWPELTDDQVKEEVLFSSKLYNHIWRPLSDIVGDVELVIIAPDGTLSLIPFAGFRLPDETFLVERYAIHYLSTGRDLIRLDIGFTPGKGLLAIGDPDYNATISGRFSGLNDATEVGNYTENQQMSRKVESDCETLRQMEVARLPFTRREVRKITDIWMNKDHDEAILLLDSLASEENFKRYSSGKLVIHLATHGFFVSEYCDDRESQPDKSTSRVLSRYNPLLYSGLFFAGANRHGISSDNSVAEDGILTAYEVAGMNLDSTRWVVLSACESGLGKIQTGEGVYGLRRAFLMAGVRTVLSSLWRIPDKQTVSLMEQLYSSTQKNLAFTMRQIAFEQINSLREQNLPDHPFSWGAFIATGDWKVDD